jgi:hypothetical protein
MQFPVTLYHKDNGTPEFVADARHSQYTTYPIVVQDQEAFDRLGPGWHEDPIAAADWKSDADVAESSDEPEAEEDFVDDEPEQTEDDEQPEAPKKRKLPTTRKK